MEDSDSLPVSKIDRVQNWIHGETGEVPTGRILAIVAASILIFNIVTISSVVLTILLWRIRFTLLLVGLGGFMALVLNPPVAYLVGKGWKRSFAASLVFLVALVGFFGIGYLFVHPVYVSANHLVASFPNLVKDAAAGRGPIGQLVQRFHLEKWVNSNQPKIQSGLKSLAKPALAAGAEVAKALIDAATVSFIAFFILVQGPSLAGSAVSLLKPNHANRLKHIGREVSKAVTGYVIGDFLTSVIAGIIVGITLMIFGVPYAAVLAIWVGLVDFLPLVGGLLAGAPVVFVATLHSLPAGIVTLIVFLIYQQIENHVLYPIIMSKTTRLNPLWVLLAVLVAAGIGNIVGSSLGAIVGAVMAIPVAGAIQVVAREIWSILKESRVDSEQANLLER